MDIVKSSAKEYDPESLSLPNSEQIKAKLIAVDKYYGFDKMPQSVKKENKGFAQIKTEKEKERPSWGYIMERPLLEQYVLMNNYIRKASVLAELENIEEMEKTGKQVEIKEYETDTDISLPSDYETELRQYRKFSMMKDSSNDNANLTASSKQKIFKDNRKTIMIDPPKRGSKYRGSSSIKSESTKSKRVTFADLIMPKRESPETVEPDLTNCPSDSDPPTSYKYLPPEFITQGSSFNELEHVTLSKGKKSPKKSDTSAIEKFATKFGIIRERRSSHPVSINEDDDDESDDSSDDSLQMRSTGSSLRSNKLSQTLNQSKEKPLAFAESSRASDKPFSSIEENDQRNRPSKFQPREYFNTNDSQNHSNDGNDMNSPDVEQKESFLEVPEEFSPKNFISPIEVLRIQAEEMKKEKNKKDYDINDMLAKSLTGNKKFNVPLKNLIAGKFEQSKGNRRETMNMLSLLKDFGKFEPIPSTSNSPDVSLERKNTETHEANTQISPPSRSSVNKSLVELPSEDDKVSGVKRQKGIEKYVEDLKSNGLDQISLIRKTPSMEIVEAEKRRRINKIIEEKNQAFQKSLSLDRKEFSNEIIDGRKRSQSMDLERIKMDNPELEAGKRSQSLDIQQQINLALKNFKSPAFQLEETVPLDKKSSQLDITKDFQAEEIFSTSESDESDSSVERWVGTTDANKNLPSYTKGAKNLNIDVNTDIMKNPDRTGLSVNNRSFPFRETDNKRNFSTLGSKPAEFTSEMDERKTSIVERSQAIFDANRNERYSQDSNRKKSEEKYNKLMKHPYLDLVPDERKKQLSMRGDDKMHSLFPDEFNQEMRHKLSEDKRRKSQFPKQ
ncbi:uncharacterized protein LOC106669403 isoform X2 [Cimex lectularius]|nr:uncharacterized protein LOC106669403 isoform X2 [Cimex lectularius]XP_024084483.1 uncharacterized protein LOC106669403 isoform X2 [Cimex lectularius]